MELPAPILVCVICRRSLLMFSEIAQMLYDFVTVVSSALIQISSSMVAPRRSTSSAPYPSSITVRYTQTSNLMAV
ncbi:hypothetical protein BVRB_7g157670 [Beta vulgaris subsp. vulgaris]|nr:hypothetical protein BVRB_7g157670 [Beta vulgaris subsp. vulgaris]